MFQLNVFCGVTQAHIVDIRSAGDWQIMTCDCAEYKKGQDDGGDAEAIGHKLEGGYDDAWQRLAADFREP